MMIVNLRHLFLSLFYGASLSWLLLYEIVPYWSYMNYGGEFSEGGLVAALGGSAFLGMSVPTRFDTRGMIVTALNYLFFVPAVVYISFSGLQIYHIISFIFVFVGVYYISSLKMSPLTIAPLRQSNIFLLIFVMIVFAIASQAAFGGLHYFSLDIEKVYEFRNISAAEVPGIFGYIFSNASNVLIPLALTLALRFKRYFFAALIVVCATILFGMTHHKSVLFTPFVVVLLYILFATSRSSRILGIAFLAIPCIAIAEILYIHYVLGAHQAGYFTSLTVRRVLFTPAMLDTLFLDFFERNPLYYWSASRFASWIHENPYGITAPYVIGIEYFASPQMAANTGAIGSGYANAGLFGVALYSVAIGLFIGMLNGYGARIGHAAVAAVSFVLVFYVVTTTDLTTALLTHGLLLLVFILALFPGTVDQQK